MDRLLLKISDVQEATGLGRTRIYELVRSGDLRAVHIGKSIRVPVAALEEFVRDLDAGDE